MGDELALTGQRLSRGDAGQAALGVRACAPNGRARSSPASVADDGPCEEGVARRVVEDYYSAKTRELILRYGPGPRIHYHVRLFDSSDVNTTTASKEMVRKRIVAAQEALMHRAAEVWGVAAQPPRSVMDIGCGLGGGTISPCSAT